MGKLTQQKYDLTCALMKAGLEIHSGNEHLLFSAVDAYADAMEKETKRQLGLCNLMQSAATDMLCAKDDEIAELKSANKLSSSSWRKDCEERDDKITQLKAEIKWLRDAIRELWNRDAISLEEMRQILSPAPVTETQNEE